MVLSDILLQSSTPVAAAFPDMVDPKNTKDHAVKTGKPASAHESHWKISS